MGQYHYVVNLDKKQYLRPHRFGDGLKLLEFGSSGQGTMLGPGDLRSYNDPQDAPDVDVEPDDDYDPSDAYDDGRWEAP